MNQRKVSDAVIEMEAKMAKLSGLVQNTDNNVKLILGRLNQLLQAAQQPIEAVAPPLPKATKIPGEIPQPSDDAKRRALALEKLRNKAKEKSEDEGYLAEEDDSEESVEEEEQVEVLVAGPRDESDLGITEDGSREIEVATVQTGSRRTARVQPKKTGKMPVSQQILLKDGKPLFLANVEIFNENGMSIGQLRTNNNGRWVTALEAGTYSVTVKKKNSKDSSQVIDVKYQIKVPQGEGAMQLPSPDIDY